MRSNISLSMPEKGVLGESGLWDSPQFLNDNNVGFLIILSFYYIQFLKISPIIILEIFNLNEFIERISSCMKFDKEFHSSEE